MKNKYIHSCLSIYIILSTIVSLGQTFANELSEYRVSQISKSFEQYLFKEVKKGQAVGKYDKASGVMQKYLFEGRYYHGNKIVAVDKINRIVLTRKHDGLIQKHIVPTHIVTNYTALLSKLYSGGFQWIYIGNRITNDWFATAFNKDGTVTVTNFAKQKYVIPKLRLNDPIDPIDVSVINLIATPEKYNNKYIQVEGYVHIKFEDMALYLSKESADYLNGQNAIWLDFNKDFLKIEPQNYTNLWNFDCKYVLIEGVFDKNDSGHMSSFAGSINNVRRIKVMTRWYNGKRELE